MNIFRSLYIESDENFKDIVNSLQYFPERLHDEMIEDISMNIYEWVNKLTQEEMETMGKNIIPKIKYSSSRYDISIYTNLLQSQESKLKLLIQKRENLVLHINEYPSLTPEIDINEITKVDCEIENLEYQIDNTNFVIDMVNKRIVKRTERQSNNLFC